MKTVVNTLALLVLLWCGLAPVARACAIATNVQGSSTSNTSVGVSFTPASSVSHYIVLLEIGGNRSARRYTTGAAVTFTGLQPAMSYHVRVGSICGVGDTTYTAYALASTATSAGTCPPVTNVVIGTVTNTQVELLFLPVTNAVSYTVRYWPVSDSSVVQSVTTPNPPAVLTNMRPGTTYACRIITNCGGGSTGITPFIYVQTTGAPTCGGVSNVVVTATGNSTATVSFTPGANNTSYQIICYYHSGTDSTRQVIATTSSPVTLTGLVPGHTYQIQVLAVCQSSNVTYYNSGGGIVTLNFRGTSALAATSLLGDGVIGVFPNPAHTAVTVQLPRVPGASTAHLTLLNNLGQVVRSQEVLLPASGAQAELTLTGVTPGLYSLRVAAGSQAATQRLAVE